MQMSATCAMSARIDIAAAVAAAAAAADAATYSKTLTRIVRKYEID